MVPEVPADDLAECMIWCVFSPAHLLGHEPVFGQHDRDGA